MSSCSRQVRDTYTGGWCTVGSEEMFVLNIEQMNSPLRQQLTPPFYRQHSVVLKGEVICQAHTGAEWRSWDATCLVATPPVLAAGPDKERGSGALECDWGE